MKKIVDAPPIRVHSTSLSIKETPDNWRLLSVASVAQQVEHVLGKDGVGGSNPL